MVRKYSQASTASPCGVEISEGIDAVARAASPAGSNRLLGINVSTSRPVLTPSGDALTTIALGTRPLRSGSTTIIYDGPSHRQRHDNQAQMITMLATPSPSRWRRVSMAIDKGANAMANVTRPGSENSFLRRN